MLVRVEHVVRGRGIVFHYFYQSMAKALGNTFVFVMVLLCHSSETNGRLIMCTREQWMPPGPSSRAIPAGRSTLV